MKQLILWLVRVVLIVAPCYNIYEFAINNDGNVADPVWLKDNALFILWSLGAYALLFIASFNGLINWKQLMVTMVAAAGLVYFYFTPDIYSLFLDIPFFQDDNRTKLPYIPYAFVVLVLLLNRLLKTRYRIPAK